jgi:hypothetical protein
MLLAATPATAATPCDGIWQKDKTQGLALLKPFLTKASITNLPAKATVHDHMQVGGWDIVWADFADAEPGGFVIHDKKLVQNWGGSGPETAQELTQWMLKQTKTMPKPLAACFGWYVAGGRTTKAAWPNPFNR